MFYKATLPWVPFNSHRLAERRLHIQMATDSITPSVRNELLPIASLLGVPQWRSQTAVAQSLYVNHPLAISWRRLQPSCTTGRRLFRRGGRCSTDTIQDKTTTDSSGSARQSSRDFKHLLLHSTASDKERAACGLEDDACATTVVDCGKLAYWRTWWLLEPQSGGR